jgi:hypothetical protein
MAWSMVKSMLLVLSVYTPSVHGMFTGQVDAAGAKCVQSVMKVFQNSIQRMITGPHVLRSTLYAGYVLLHRAGL